MSNAGSAFYAAMLMLDVWMNVFVVEQRKFTFTQPHGGRESEINPEKLQHSMGNRRKCSTINFFHLNLRHKILNFTINADDLLNSKAVEEANR
jgi:hypothetical protein